MKIIVKTYNEIKGFHKWNEAENFLRDKHRHIFHIICYFEVLHLNRQIEIFEMEDYIENKIKLNYGSPAQFENLSCEGIGMFLMKVFEEYNIIKVEVNEDGKGGAIIEK